jgi:hypothetical protein
MHVENLFFSINKLQHQSNFSRFYQNVIVPHNKILLMEIRTVDKSLLILLTIATIYSLPVLSSLFL